MAIKTYGTIEDTYKYSSSSEWCLKKNQNAPRPSVTINTSIISDSNVIVNLANGGFACDIRYHIIGVCLSSFACRPATTASSVAAVL